MQESSLLSKTPSSFDVYRGLATTVERYAFCVNQVAELQGGGSNEVALQGKTISVASIDWSSEKTTQYSLYKLDLKQMKREICERSIFLQRIWSYEDKIYEKEDPNDLTSYIKWGIRSTNTCLIAGALVFVVLGIIDLVIYTTRSNSHSALPAVPLSICASLLFFVAAYGFNIAFILALRAHKDDIIAKEEESSGSGQPDTSSVSESRSYGESPRNHFIEEISFMVDFKNSNA